MIISEIFSELGEDHFRYLESEAVKKVGKISRRVIATGGGTPLFSDNTAALKKNGKMVLLDVDKETLFNRIMSKGLPSFFDPKDPRGSFEKIFKEKRQKNHYK